MTVHAGEPGPTIQLGGDTVSLTSVMRGFDVVRYSLRVIRVVHTLRSVYAVSIACCEQLSREMESHART